MSNSYGQLLVIEVGYLFHFGKSVRCLCDMCISSMYNSFFKLSLGLSVESCDALEKGVSRKEMSVDPIIKYNRFGPPHGVDDEPNLPMLRGHLLAFSML